MKFRVLGDKIAVERIEVEPEEKATESGIIIAGQDQAPKAYKYIVAVVGDEVAGVKVGDQVLVEAWVKPLEIGDGQFVFVKPEELVCVYE